MRTMCEVKIRLKGHETFFIREGWLTKGMAAVEHNPKVFTKNMGADALGVGTNMAKAIRYWLREGGYIRERGREGAILTEIGHLVYEKDRYFEDDFSLWLFHMYLAQNGSGATSWYVFFHMLESEAFTKEELFREMKKNMLLYGNGREVSERSLWDDCMVLLHMYCTQTEEGYDPEDKRRSPFAHLRLVRKSGDRYQKIQPDYATLDPYAVWYLIQEYFRKSRTNAVHMDWLLKGEGMPGKVMNLTRAALYQYIDQLAEEGCLIVNRTAGLDMVYQNIVCSGEEVVFRYYEKGHQNAEANRNC